VVVGVYVVMVKRGNIVKTAVVAKYVNTIRYEEHVKIVMEKPDASTINFVVYV
jgi:hypothetical protein